MDRIRGLLKDNSAYYRFSGAPKSLQMVTAAMKLRHLFLGRKVMTNLDSILKSRDRGRSQDGGGIGRGDHFLFYKFIERTTER